MLGFNFKAMGASDYSFDIVQLFSSEDWQPICWITITWYAVVSVGSTVGLFLFSMSVCRFQCWFVFVFYECLSVPPLVCFCFLWVSVGTVELTDTHRKQINGGTDRHSLKTKTNQRWNWQTLIPPLVCFCFLSVSVGSTVGLFWFSMSVCRFHRWFVFVFYECLSVPPLVCFCFLWVSVSLENKNKPTVETTDTHRKQKQTNCGTDRHS
jgi:EamA domain-containing membrane protein RarD